MSDKTTEKQNYTFIQSVMFSADLIKDYQNHSKNIFKNIIARKKMLKLASTLNKIDNTTIHRSTLIEFISVYNGSYDFFRLGDITTYINDDTKVYTMLIATDDKDVHITTTNIPNLDDINIIITRRGDNMTKLIKCHESLYSPTNEAVKTINNVVIDIIKAYLEIYIFGNKTE